MPLNVIYLDDEPDLCEWFTDQFSSTEISVTAFTDPKKAIAAAWSRAPDLIFLDNRLPQTKGEDVARAMPDGIPKYLITGEIEVSTKYEFTGIFSKPLENKLITSIFNDFQKRMREKIEAERASS